MGGLFIICGSFVGHLIGFTIVAMEFACVAPYDAVDYNVFRHQLHGCDLSSLGLTVGIATVAVTTVTNCGTQGVLGYMYWRGLRTVCYCVSCSTEWGVGVVI